MANEFFADYVAWLLTQEYGFDPEPNLKYEKVPNTNSIGSHFIANHSNRTKILIQYNTEDLPPPS